MVTDNGGNVISRRDFLPFGEELNAGTASRTETNKYSTSGTDNVRQRFTGYEKDTETGLDFAEARMYENKYGRFTAVDPLLASGQSADPQTFNRYVYVANNPINSVDPTGMWSDRQWNSIDAGFFAPEFSGFIHARDLNQRVTGTQDKIYSRAGEARWESILKDGYDPDFDRFENDVEINYNCGTEVKCEGKIVLPKPTLEQVNDKVAEFSSIIDKNHTEASNQARRHAVMHVIQSTPLGSLVSSLKIADEGFYFTITNENSGDFNQFLDDNFISGSLSGFHAKGVGCGKGKKCSDNRSPAGSLGTRGSVQIVYNSNDQFGYIDLDRFNVYQDVRGFLGHTFLEVLGSKTPPIAYSPNISRINQARRNYDRLR